MAQQETSGFRFDLEAAERVKAELQEEMGQIEDTLRATYVYVPGKVFTPKRKNKRRATKLALL